MIDTNRQSALTSSFQTRLGLESGARQFGSFQVDAVQQYNMMGSFIGPGPQSFIVADQNQ